jgi:hypothetical protein
LRSVLAQGCVHGGASCRVGIALHHDDVSLEAARALR